MPASLRSVLPIKVSAGNTVCSITRKLPSHWFRICHLISASLAITSKPTSAAVSNVNMLLSTELPLQCRLGTWSGFFENSVLGLGFEPRFTESESVVLPLDDPRIAGFGRSRARLLNLRGRGKRNSSSAPRVRMRRRWGRRCPRFREWRRSRGGVGKRAGRKVGGSPRGRFPQRRSPGCEVR